MACALPSEGDEAHHKEVAMTCGRCGACMQKTELYLSKTLEKIKTVSAWRCDHCGRIEYYCSSSSGDVRYLQYPKSGGQQLLHTRPTSARRLPDERHGELCDGSGHVVFPHFSLRAP